MEQRIGESVAAKLLGLFARMLNRCGASSHYGADDWTVRYRDDRVCKSGGTIRDQTSRVAPNPQWN